MTPDVEIEGYAEVRLTDQVGVEGVPWNLTERVRPRFQIPIGDRVTVETVVEGALTQGRDTTGEAAALLLDSELGTLLEENCTYTPESRYDQVSDYLSVERLHVDLNLAEADITIGRQAVNWGSGLVFHPTDLYAEVLANEPWRERKGVNSVKALVPIGDHQVTALVAVGDDLSPLWDERPEALDVSAAIKTTIRAGGTDISAVAHVQSDGDWFAGADLRGNVEVGWWVEGGWHGDAAAAEVVAGVDYSFDVLQVLYVAAEYRYDGTGELPEDYDYTARGSGASMPFDCAFLPTQSAEEPRTTLGIHYVDAVVRLGVTEDINVSAVGLVNVLDGTGYALPTASANVGSHAVVNVGAQIPFGADGEFRPAKEDLTYAVADLEADLSPLLPDATLLAWVRYSF
jgi:hypothetical protein